MAFGLMRKAVHEMVVAALEGQITALQERVDYLDFKARCLQDIVDTQKEALALQAPKSVEIKVETPKIEAKQVVPAKIQAAPTKPTVVETKTPTSASARNGVVRLQLLEAVLPKAKLERNHHSISVMFNSKMTKIRLAQPSKQTNGDANIYYFLNVAPGDVCVMVNEDQSLRAVFVATHKLMVRSGKSAQRIVVPQNSETDLQLIQNTSLVMRNFK